VSICSATAAARSRFETPASEICRTITSWRGSNTVALRWPAPWDLRKAAYSRPHCDAGLARKSRISRRRAPARRGTHAHDSDFEIAAADLDTDTGPERQQLTDFRLAGAGHKFTSRGCKAPGMIARPTSVTPRMLVPAQNVIARVVLR